MNMFSYDFASYGNSIPMIEFLDTLSLKERALIYKNIQKLVEYKSHNFNISEKFSKHLEDGIFELKVELQSKTSRSLYFFEKNKEIIFTNGFIKKSRKTPKREIEKAKNITEAYKNE